MRKKLNSIMPATDAEVLARNKRKIEKDRRRKHYHDSQVQGTNNSSIVSKRSVEMIYNPIIEPGTHEWFKHFVPKAKRRSPAINRGYWIRMESIKQMVERILCNYPGQPVRVVNLGCGFDPLPFQILEKHNRFHFYDFDYPDLVQRKLAMIRESPEIMLVVGQAQALSAEEEKIGIVFRTKNYTLVGCDLKNTLLYQQQLQSLLSGGGATIFIAEVSLAYMKPEHANPVIEILSRICSSHFVVLEQIMPAGDKHFFAQKMLYHFSHLRSPLQCVETYSTRDKQKRRFEEYFPNVEIRDLFESWQSLVSAEKKHLVQSVEDFDEWEEFIVFCQHYVIIHATNSSNVVFGEAAKEEELEISVAALELQVTEISLELKFPAACTSDDKVLVHGGMWQSRNDQLLKIEHSLIEPVPTEAGPSARMCHSLTNAQNGSLVLVGGRTHPGHHLDDVWVYKESKWQKFGALGSGMSRHSAVCTEPGVVLVFGNGQFVTINLNEETIKSAPALGIPPLKSCGMAYDPSSNSGYIVGGMQDETEPDFNCTVYRYTIEKSIITEEIMHSPHFGRIGCMATIKNKNLLVIGGVGQKLQTQNTTLVLVDAKSHAISGVKISDAGWRTCPVFIGSQLVDGTIIVGGGAVCYSFGSCYSGMYRIIDI